MAAREETVGNIIAFLRLDITDWEAKLREAKDEARALSDTDVTIHVRSDTGDTQPKLDDIARDVDRLGREDATVHVREQGAAETLAALRAVGDERASMGRKSRIMADAERTALEQVTIAQRAYEDAQRGSRDAADNLIQAMQRSLSTEDDIATATDKAEEATRREENARSNLERVTREQADALDRAAREEATYDAISRSAARDTSDLAHATRDSADATDRSSNSTNRASNTWVRLAQTLAPIVPALVPIAAGLAATGLGFVALGVTAELALRGIKADIANGSAEGQRFESVVTAMQADLTTLENVAAAPLLRPLAESVQILNAHMPALDGEIHMMSTALGTVLTHVLDGVLNLMVDFAPILDEVAAGAARLATEFDRWSQSAGATRFVQYLQQSLPEVDSALGSLVGVVARVVEAFAPLGQVVGQVLLGAITAVGNAIRAIPLPVLTAIGTAAAVAYAGFKLWGMVTPMIESVSGSLVGLIARLGAVDASEAATAATTSALKLAFGSVLAVIGLAVTAWALWSAHQQAAKAAQDELTQSIVQNNGAVTTQTRNLMAQQIAQSGILRDAQQLGISYKTVNSAIMGNKNAQQQLLTQLDANRQGTTTLNSAQLAMGRSSRTMSSTAQDAKSKFEQLSGTWSGAKSKASALVAEQRALGQSADATAAPLSLEQEAMMRVTGATNAQQTALQALVTQQQAETNNALAVASAQNTLDQATLTMNSTLRTNNGTVAEHTAKGIADRQAIEAVVAAIWQQNSANIANGMQIGRADAIAQHRIGTLEANINKTYGARSATAQYTDALGRIPKDVSTVIHAYTAGAAANVRGLMSLIASVHGKTVVIGVERQVNSWGGGYKPHAMGGITATAYALGGIAENHQAQVVSSGPRLWAEPETGGEAYIPLANDHRRQQAITVLEDVAVRFGRQTVPLGSFSTTGPVPSGGSSAQIIAQPVDQGATASAVGQAAYAAIVNGMAAHDARAAAQSQSAARRYTRSGFTVGG